MIDMFVVVGVGLECCEIVWGELELEGSIQPHVRDST